MHYHGCSPLPRLLSKQVLKLCEELKVKGSLPDWPGLHSLPRTPPHSSSSPFSPRPWDALGGDASGSSVNSISAGDGAVGVSGGGAGNLLGGSGGHSRGASREGGDYREAATSRGGGAGGDSGSGFVGGGTGGGAGARSANSRWETCVFVIAGDDGVSTLKCFVCGGRLRLHRYVVHRTSWFSCVLTVQDGGCRCSTRRHLDGYPLTFCELVEFPPLPRHLIIEICACSSSHTTSGAFPCYRWCCPCL